MYPQWLHGNSYTWALSSKVLNARQIVAIWRIELIHETQCNGQLLLFLLKPKVYILRFSLYVLLGFC